MKRNNLLIEFINKIRWPFGYLVFFISACTQPAAINSLVLSHTDSVQELSRITNAFQKIENLTDSIKTGDLITRTGNDFTSETLRNLNRRDKTYSHCGIAVIENDSLFIYHALGGEFNPDQKLLRESFRNFAEPYSNKGIGVYRFDLTANSVLELCTEIHQKHKEGVMFDMDFDLDTDNRMYCAEFVLKMYRKISDPQLKFNISQLGKFNFIGVDDIFLNDHCKKVMALVYK